MSDCKEVLFASDNGGKLYAANCFDPHIGTTLMTYRGGGGGASKRTLSVIGSDYLMSADTAKPILHVWPLNSQEPLHNLQMVVSGKPSSLSISPDGCYCVAGIEGKIYVWHTSSGNLLNVISRHYQAVNKILFTEDSSHFITAGEDGLVMVWKLADVVAKQLGDIFKITTSQIEPIYHFSHHSLPVADVFVGSGNLKSRLFTVSPDQTCKIYCLSSGTLLLSIVFEYVLTSVTVNELETELFVGTSCGKIKVFNLDPYPRTLEYHITDCSDALTTFNGHSKAVTCLSTSFDGITLASGSDDEKVFLWNIPSKQLIRSFNMKGAVSNLFFYFAPSNIFSQKFNPNLVVNKFDKIGKLDERNLEMNVLIKDNLKSILLRDNSGEDLKERQVLCKNKNDDEGDLATLKQKVLNLKDVNKQLYQFAMSNILKSPIAMGMQLKN